jgi:hypothetical protein
MKQGSQNVVQVPKNDQNTETIQIIELKSNLDRNLVVPCALVQCSNCSNVVSRVNNKLESLKHNTVFWNLFVTHSTEVQ